MTHTVINQPVSSAYIRTLRSPRRCDRCRQPLVGRGRICRCCGAAFLRSVLPGVPCAGASGRRAAARGMNRVS